MLPYSLNVLSLVLKKLERGLIFYQFMLLTKLITNVNESDVRVWLNLL